MTDWKRAKEIPCKTEHIELACGKLHLIFGYEEEDGRLIEVIAKIGRSGVCGCVLLDSFGKVLSMLLQSPAQRYKIVEKMKKQFKGVVCSQGEKSCINEIAERVIKELS